MLFISGQLCAAREGDDENPTKASAFMIDELGPDSMYLENNAGIFTFKRQV